MSGWGVGYLAEGARGSRGPIPPLDNHQHVDDALNELFEGKAEA